MNCDAKGLFSNPSSRRAWQRTTSGFQIGEEARSVTRAGLADSRYGIVVLSRSFLRGGWSRHELRGLWQREIHVGKTILPILHDITLDEVRDFDPSLADLRALDTSRHDLDEIVATTLRFLKGERTNGHSPPTADPLDVHGLADLAGMSGSEVLKRLERYATAARLTPGSGDVALGLALTHLHLRRFPEAIQASATAVQLLPASGKAQLYHALALLKARKPRSLTLHEARRILQALETAASLEPRDGLCELFSLVIKQEFFRLNGLRVPDPGVEHHRRAAAEKRIDRDELTAFRGLFELHDPTLLDVRAR